MLCPVSVPSHRFQSFFFELLRVKSEALNLKKSLIMPAFCAILPTLNASQCLRFSSIDLICEANRSGHDAYSQSGKKNSFPFSNSAVSFGSPLVASILRTERIIGSNCAFLPHFDKQLLTRGKNEFDLTRLSQVCL